jgi:hypothetical protein
VRGLEDEEGDNLEGFWCRYRLGPRHRTRSRYAENDLVVPKMRNVTRDAVTPGRKFSRSKMAAAIVRSGVEDVSRLLFCVREMTW